MKHFDRIIIGAGIYGLYGALVSLKKSYSTLIIDIEDGPFQRGSYVNQARLHNGYHYPRSFSTAKKSAQYFERFYNDYKTCINSDFVQVYAIASNYSWTNSTQFEHFCDSLELKCDKINKNQFFSNIDIESAYITEEYSFDAELLSHKMYQDVINHNGIFSFGMPIQSIKKEDQHFIITLKNGDVYSTNYILNATYAGTNQIHSLMGYEKLPIKYELCEIILCTVSDNLKNYGLTVMDGPFFSIMPFGKTKYHSITTVSRTPHYTCYETLPSFDCQHNDDFNQEDHRLGCIACKSYPKTAFPEMRQIAKKYLNNDIDIQYVKSLFTVKPIMTASEIDDSRPTIIRKYSEKPEFYTVFSGKINTMYDLDSIL
jgi:glycine/D-amino acid oxidase-like deaminating enzyme